MNTQRPNRGRVWDLVGNTPLILIESLSRLTGCKIYGKAEFLNPGGSVKDRAAKGIIADAEARGRLKPGGTIVEGTAGNTGIGIATLAADRGYKSIIVMPDNQAHEKYEILEMLGAEVRRVPPVPFSNPHHFYHTAKTLSENIAGSFWADQFNNPANGDFHFTTTGPEIWAQTEGKLDLFTCAVGTSGTMSGISRFLKEKKPGVRTVAADPPGSGIYCHVSEGKMEGSGQSVTEGIGIMRITENYKSAQIDSAIRVSDQEMIDMVYHVAEKDGLILGTSSGVNLTAAYRLAQENQGSGKTIVTILCDHGTRYSSRLLNRAWLEEKNLVPRRLVHTIAQMICILGLAFSAAVAGAQSAPVAPERPHEMQIHGDVRMDPYFWLRDRNDPETIEYLKSESAYAESILKPLSHLRAALFKELKSHISDTDESFPAREGSYLYYWKIGKGQDFQTHFRREARAHGREQVLLDENVLAKGHDSMRVGALEVSDDESKLAYSVDLKGDRIFTISFKDLRSGKVLDEKIEGASGEIVWSADGTYVFYVKPEPATLRSRWVYRHEMGKSQDDMIFDEKDEKFDVEISKTLSRRYIVLRSHSKTTGECSLLEAQNPLAKPKLFQARKEGVLYSVDDGGDRFFIKTNAGAENFRLMETALDKTDLPSWKETIPSRPDVYLEAILSMKNFVVLQEREKGLTHLKIISRADGSTQTVESPGGDSLSSLGENREYDAPSVRFYSESLKTPYSTVDYDLKTKKQIVRKVQNVPGGFKSSRYESERLTAKAEDGTSIPISLVYKKGLRKGSRSPLLLNGYGSYGYAYDPIFDRSILPLLDRGFTFAIAHVRGGSDLGRRWYLDGKMMRKQNTFKDFIACAEHLIKTGWTSSEHLYAKGASAGGLLMGAVMNQRGDLFRGVIAGVPFVDVLTTMLDASLPLTTGEYEEWGNPNDKAAYEYMKTYSPYDNVSRKSYPNLFVTTGLNDSQVGYWEPAKWVARLRKMKTDKNLLLFLTEMNAGHGGKNGRFSALEKTAKEEAFLLMLEGAKK